MILGCHLIGTASSPWGKHVAGRTPQLRALHWRIRGLIASLSPALSVVSLVKISSWI